MKSLWFWISALKTNRILHIYIWLFIIRFTVFLYVGTNAEEIIHFRSTLSYPQTEMELMYQITRSIVQNRAMVEPQTRQVAKNVPLSPPHYMHIAFCEKTGLKFWSSLTAHGRIVLKLIRTKCFLTSKFYCDFRT